MHHLTAYPTNNFILCIYSFFMVGDDATDKIGVGVPQCCHELGEWLLVELSHGAKHALFCFIGGTKRGLIHSCHLVQAHDTIDWWGDGKNWLEQEDFTGRITAETAVAMQWHNEATWPSADGWKRHYRLLPNSSLRKKHQSTWLTLASEERGGA